MQWITIIQWQLKTAWFVFFSCILLHFCSVSVLVCFSLFCKEHTECTHLDVLLWCAEKPWAIKQTRSRRCGTTGGVKELTGKKWISDFGKYILLEGGMKVKKQSVQNSIHSIGVFFLLLLHDWILWLFFSWSENLNVTSYQDVSFINNEQSGGAAWDFLSN